MESKVQQLDNYVNFSLGNEYFGIKVSKVLEVLENENINKVPEAPDNVLGVVNFRGDIIPVIDLNKRFKIKPNEKLPGVIIILDLHIAEEKLLVGIKVDRVMGVAEIQTKDVRNAPEVGISFNPKFIDGMVHYDERVLLLINPDLLVSREEISEIEE
ncbi:MAG: chemotaxis protein CheW [Bacteroidales bacterium]|nr:chemotaxis protein CheW [Bacteroidales bacterium]